MGFFDRTLQVQRPDMPTAWSLWPNPISACFASLHACPREAITLRKNVLPPRSSRKTRRFICLSPKKFARRGYLGNDQRGPLKSHSSSVPISADGFGRSGELFCVAGRVALIVLFVFLWGGPGEMFVPQKPCWSHVCEDVTQKFRLRGNQYVPLTNKSYIQ